MTIVILIVHMFHLLSMSQLAMYSNLALDKLALHTSILRVEKSTLTG